MIFLRPYCWLFGHKRGKSYRELGDYSSEQKTFRCPRCGRTTRYKIRSVPTQNEGTAGDQA